MAEHGGLFEHEGLAATVLDGETVFAVIGAHEDGDVVEVWVILSDEAKARPVALCRVARVFVREFLLKYGYIKARAVCDVHRRWAEHLGFVFDNDVGVLRA